MPTEDTINLLKECDAGCKMGIDAIKQVIDKNSQVLWQKL